MKQLLVLLALTSFVQPILALPSFDPFADATAVPGGTSYTVGTPLASQTNSLLQGWGSLGSNFFGVEPMIVEGNLSYPGLPASTGNSVEFVGAANMGARLDLKTNGNSGTFYYSYILKITNITAVPTTNANNAFAGFSDTAGAQPQQLARLSTRVVTKLSDSGYVIGLARNNIVADYVYDTNVHNVDEVLFIVGSYELVGGVTNVNLWINPDTNTFGAATPPPPTISAPNFSGTGGALNANGVRSFAILCQNPTAPSGIIDELRVEKTWKYVTVGEQTEPVTITAQPTPRTVEAGEKVSFAVGVIGTLPGYQWLSNGVPITGANLASYSLINVQPSGAASYSVVVTNSLNSVTSSPVALTVSVTPLRFYNTNLVVMRIGDGAQTLSATGNSISMDQFTRGGSYLHTQPIPDDGPSAMVAIGPAIAGTSITGNCLSRSADHRFLVLGGYNTNLTYGANLQNSLSTDVPRGLGLIDFQGQYTLSVSNTDTYSQTFWRGGVTDNGTNFWGAASGTIGTYYFGFQSAPEVVQNQFGNVRSIAVFNWNIYCVSAVSGNNGVLKLSGMPQTAATANPVVLFPGSAASSDLEVSPDGNLIYLADDRNTPNGGVQKWQFDGFNWNRLYTLTNGLLNGARYVTANFSGTNPVVFAITTEGDNNQIVAIEDTGESSAGTILARAGANQVFRGIRFGPSETAVLPPSQLLFAREGNELILNWEGPFVLQSATNVSGIYSDVLGATSPHTNNLGSAQLYFRLRNP